MWRIQILVLSLLASLSACVAAPVGSDEIVNISALGKADGDGFFSEEWTVFVEGTGLWVDGERQSLAFEEVEIRPWSTGEIRVRLKEGDDLAGMRSFLLVGGEVKDRLRWHRVQRAAGLSTPRAVGVRLTVDGEDRGASALIEHVGDKFLRAHFDADTELAEVLRTPSASLESLLGEGDAASLARSFDLPAMGRAIAAAEALGLGEYAFFDRCGDGCLVPIPETGAQVVTGDAMRNALAHPDVADGYQAALAPLVRCLSEPRCGDDGEAAARLAAARLDPADGAVGALTEVARVDLSIREPSGLALHDGLLFVVGDESDDVYVVDPESGEVLSRIDVDARGLEGLAVDSHSETIYVADEDRGLIIACDFAGESIFETRLDWAEDDRDGGIEGLTIDVQTGNILLAKERAPIVIAELDRDGNELRRSGVEGVSDISALALNPLDGALYALSDQDQTLLRFDAEWNVTHVWPLDIDKPEGLVVDGRTVYVVSDADRELVTYTLGR